VPSWLALLLAVLLLAGNAFFVASEFAVISARRSSVEPLAEAGNRRARTVLWAMEHVSLMLAAAQVGVTICSTSLGVVAEPAIAHVIEAPLDALGVPPSLTHLIAFVIGLAIVVYLHVVLGEMVPKNLAVSGPDRVVLFFGPPLVWFARVLRPVIAALNWLANHAVRLLRVEPRDEVASAFTAQEVHSIVERSAAEGLIEDTQGLITSSIEFSDRTAGDVMVRPDALISVAADSTPADVERLVARTGFSRFPVLSPEGEPTGYVHLKDVLYADEASREHPVPTWRVRSFAVVAPGDEVEDALAAMQRSGSHLARVEEAGETVGIVFLEDILEELVGEVRDAMQRDQSA
jgi:CBS domain containing-hemolysin-like protein